MFALLVQRAWRCKSTVADARNLSINEENRNKGRSPLNYPRLIPRCNMDQIIQGHNGFLCDNKDSVYKNIVYLVEHNMMRSIMSENAFRLSKSFTTEKIISKFIEFIEA